MLQTIEVEIDANGAIQPMEHLPKLPAGRALLTLLESPIQEPTATPKPDFKPLFGLLKAKQGVTLEEMDEAIKRHARAKYHAGD